MGTFAPPYEERMRSDRIWARRQIDAFIGRPIYQTVEEVARLFDDAGLPYALTGDLALGEHGVDRWTSVEILVTKPDLEAFREHADIFGFVPSFPGAKKQFRSIKTDVEIKFVTAGEFPGDGKPKAIGFPDPEKAFRLIENLRVIQLERLIELRLVSGRLKDLAGIQDLIRQAKLPPDLADRLDESVRQEYLKRWRLAQVPSRVEEEPPATE